MPRDLAYLGAKRVLDVALAAVALVLLLPLMVLVGLAIRATSPGPALFRQTRVGRSGSRFTMLKFRTMRADADDAVHRGYVTRLLSEEEAPHGGSEGVYKLTDDPRITPLGRILRRTSIDELPQLLNVLAGQMSLVGPRPALPWEVELYDAHELRRLVVKPGLTGLWQVSGRSTLPMRRALALDVEYALRRSILLDLSILVRTVPVLLHREQAR